VLAGERMVRAELGEDADERAPEQVAALRVALGRERVLQQFERQCVIALVPGGECGLELIVAGEPGPGRQAVGQEVAARGLEQLEGFFGIVAPQQDPRQRSLGLRVAGVELESAAPAASSSASEGTIPSRKRSISGGGSAPANSETTRPSLKALTAGIPRIPKRADSAGLASTSSLASSTFSARAATARSSAGPRALQGPHHSAQKSTTTGSSCERSTTRCSKAASSTSNTFGATATGPRLTACPCPPSCVATTS
jgi:hypothetical protein